ncbi:MAG TPA: glycosyl hydrolase family 65 protein, partial [Casimicrobiaceae bacterium]
LLVESLLGLLRERDTLRIAPCMPAEWTTFKLRYRYRETFYDITVAQTLDRATGQRVNVDGIDARDALVRLVDDRRDHRVAVTIPRSRDVNRGEA